MPNYKLELSNQAARTLEKIARREPHLYRRLAAALDDLQCDPFQGKPLKGRLKGRFSHRVGTYRVIYTVQRRALIVFVIDVGHRRDIYR